MIEELTPLQALCYLDDIAHGRKMSLNPHELKLIIEKQLKALEIIKEKRVDISMLLGGFYGTLKEYNSCELIYKELTEEEYELLKEVLL